jgi:hypothetical protein
MMRRDPQGRDIASTVACRRNELRYCPGVIRQALDIRGGVIDLSACEMVSKRLDELSQVRPASQHSTRVDQRDGLAELLSVTRFERSVRDRLGLYSRGSVRLLFALLYEPGEIIPYHSLCHRVECKKSSLKVMVSRLRGSLQRVIPDIQIENHTNQGYRIPRSHSDQVTKLLTENR